MKELKFPEGMPEGLKQRVAAPPQAPAQRVEIICQQHASRGCALCQVEAMLGQVVRHVTDPDEALRQEIKLVAEANLELQTTVRNRDDQIAALQARLDEVKSKASATSDVDFAEYQRLRLEVERLDASRRQAQAENTRLVEQLRTLRAATPCGTCDGSGLVEQPGSGHGVTCPECEGGVV